MESDSRKINIKIKSLDPLFLQERSNKIYLVSTFNDSINVLFLVKICKHKSINSVIKAIDINTGKLLSKYNKRFFF